MSRGDGTKAAAWRAEHQINWRAEQWAKTPLDWEGSIELRELKRLHPKYFLFWQALVAILKSSTRRGYGSYATLAVQAGCTRKTAIAAAAECRRLGLAAKRRRVRRLGNNAPNLWWLLPPPSLRSPAEDEALRAAVLEWEQAELIGGIEGAAPSALADAAGDELDEDVDAAPAVDVDAAPAPAPTYAPGEAPDDLISFFHVSVYGEAEGALHDPTRKERAQAAELIADHGYATAAWAIRAAVARAGTYRPEVLGGLLGSIKRILARRAQVGEGAIPTSAPRSSGSVDVPELYRSQEAADRAEIDGLIAGGYLPAGWSGSRWDAEVGAAQAARAAAEDAAQAARAAQEQAARAAAAEEAAQAAAARARAALPRLEALVMDVDAEVAAVAADYAGLDRTGLRTTDTFLVDLLSGNVRVALPRLRHLVATAHSDDPRTLAATVAEVEGGAGEVRHQLDQIRSGLDRLRQRRR